MIYCPFGSSSIIKNEQLFSCLQPMKVGEVYETFCEAGQNLLDLNEGLNIYKAMEKLI